MPKVIVIGLDGGTWNIIKPLVEKGKLPTISNLIKRGCSGNLESTIPPNTFTGWKAYSTGKNPGKFGVFSSINVDIEKRKLIVNNSYSYKSKEIWDYLSEAGVKCGVLNMPTTYPPKKIPNGFMVSHFFINVPNYTFPKYLENELRKKFDYKLAPDYLYTVDKDITIQECRNIIIQRFEVAQYLLNKFDPMFFHMSIFWIDHIQHYYWKYWAYNDAKYGKVIEDFWVIIDDGIKSLLNNFCDEESYVILMSDHGFTESKAEFNLARWLIKKRLFSVKQPYSRNIFLKIASHVDLVSLMRKIKVYSLLRRVIPYTLQRKIYVSLPSGDKMPRTDTMIDWEKSITIPIGDGIYINKHLIPSGEYEKFRNELINDLKNITDPRNGNKLFSEVFRREDLLKGDYVNNAPDIIALTNEGYVWFPRLIDKEWIFTPQWSGTHALYGIFCIKGPGIKKGVQIEGARIYDLAPTILHLFDIPIPKDMDGKILMNIFEEPITKITYREYIKERIKISKRIKELKSMQKI